MRACANRAAFDAQVRSELPIIGEEQPIIEAIQHHPITVLCGETGCGKSTQAPRTAAGRVPFRPSGTASVFSMPSDPSVVPTMLWAGMRAAPIAGAAGTAVPVREWVLACFGAAGHDRRDLTAAGGGNQHRKASGARDERRVWCGGLVPGVFTCWCAWGRCGA
jgi:hypothetical protein